MLQFVWKDVPLWCQHMRTRGLYDRCTTCYKCRIKAIPGFVPLENLLSMNEGFSKIPIFVLYMKYHFGNAFVLSYSSIRGPDIPIIGSVEVLLFALIVLVLCCLGLM